MIDLNLKKLLSGILAITTLASTIPSTLAANIDTDGGNSKVPAKVTAEAAHFSVTVPTTLPITVQADGTVLTADDTKIVNNSMGPVSVTKIAVEGQNGWEIVDFTSDLTSQMNQRKFGLQLISNNVQPDGTCGLVGFNVIPGNSGSLDLPYDANIAVQTSAIEKQTIANVTFTVGWDELIRLNGYKIKDSDSNELDTYNVLKNGTIDLDAYSQMSDGSESPADGGTWSSTSTDVATVDPSTGVVSPVEVGTTTIKYEQDGLSAEVTLNVTVSGYNITVPESVETSAGKYQLDIGDEVQLSVAETYSITPGSWESTAPDVLSVDSSTGKITAKSGGDATITYTRGDKQASVNFHVLTQQESIEKETIKYYDFTDDQSTGGWKVSLKKGFENAINNDSSFEDWSAGEPVPVIPSTYQGKPVTSTAGLFATLTGNNDLIIDNLDTSNVTDMSSMFFQLGMTLIIRDLDTSNVTDMSSMFNEYGRHAAIDDTLDLSMLNTSSATNMERMFESGEMKNIKLSPLFDTSKVTNMNGMFYSCNNLTSLDLSSFNTSKVTKMDMMFSNCSSLTSLDLSSFDTSKASMRYMFQYCNKFNPAYGKTQEDCNRLNANGTMYSSKNFVVKP